jgi:hypothetical protein
MELRLIIFNPESETTVKSVLMKAHWKRESVRIRSRRTMVQNPAENTCSEGSKKPC